MQMQKGIGDQRTGHIKCKVYKKGMSLHVGERVMLEHVILSSKTNQLGVVE